MYTFSNKLKTFSIILMVLGLLGVGYGFMTSHKSLDEVKTILAEKVSEHGSGHEEETTHEVAATNEHAEENTTTETSHLEGTDENHEEAHLKHVQHQMESRPWSALFVAAFFFFMIALGSLVFYAIQYAAQAGWSPVLFRVIEGITTYLLPGSIIVFLIIVFAGTHFYPWQDHELMASDTILQEKSGYLNFPFFVIRSFVFLLGWNLYRYFSRKNSLEQAISSTNEYHKKSFKISVFFLIFFIVTEAVMSWDWFMSMTPHWYSTLFAWYVFATMFVSAITVIALVIISLKSKGYLSFVNDSHLHDLGKFMFAFSIFWTYLWFSQFMLIWYANMPEEVTYFIIRIQEYNGLFFGMLALNFIFPILILMNSDYKRIPWFVIFAGIAILVGHYIDVYLLVMPSTVGENWYFGIPEISSVFLFLGLFIFIVARGLSKVSLHPEGNPFIKESEQYHY